MPAGQPAGRCWMLGVGCWSVGCWMLCSDRKMLCYVGCWANVCWCSATCWILTFVGVGLTMFGINPAMKSRCNDNLTHWFVFPFWLDWCAVLFGHISEPSRKRCFGTRFGPSGVHFCCFVQNCQSNGPWMPRCSF